MKQFAKCLLILLTGTAVLTGCGGGGSSAPDVAPGPPPANGNPPAPTPLPPTPAPNQYAEATSVTATITDVVIESPPVVSFSLSDEQGVALTGLTTGNIRFTLAKLIPGEDGNASAWQSYINTVKTPAVFPDNPSAIQATSERGGALMDHGDGTYTYTFNTDITAISEPLAVAFEPSLTHRLAMQFSGGPVANPVYDWVPATGQTSNLFSRDIAATVSCNECHDQLAVHGGGRQEMKYCVTCHNPGTFEPNSQTDQDMAVLTHKIHMGRNLPSVQAGGSYLIYGFRDSLHDYSDVIFPQNLTNCTTCHVGTGTRTSVSAAATTGQGDNWNEVPTMTACASCHDDIDYGTHFGGQVDNSGCRSCHSVTGIPGSVAASHEDKVRLAGNRFQANILAVQNTSPGQFPTVTFSMTNPEADNQPYDIKTDPAFQGARLSVGIAANTLEFTNTGFGSAAPNYAQTNALTASTAVGDGTFVVTSTVAVPDGTSAPGRAATGSGLVTIEGRVRQDIGEPGSANIQNIPFTQPHQYFSIDEAGGNAVARREIVSIDKCNACHSRKVNHGNNRTDNIQACAACHNPRNTDFTVRQIAVTPPTDGKRESSLDFKVLIHALHASAYREVPYQVVGFSGFTTYVYDEEEVQYPGRLQNCNGCHINDSYRLPLAGSVLATTLDTGAVLSDPADDTLVTAISSTCSSCHDSALASAHMTQNGGDFSATEASITGGASTETCTVCHGPGRISDIDIAHGID